MANDVTELTMSDICTETMQQDDFLHEVEF